MSRKARWLLIVLGGVYLLGGILLLAKKRFFISTDYPIGEGWENEGVFVMILLGAALLFFGVRKIKPPSN